MPRLAYWMPLFLEVCFIFESGLMDRCPLFASYRRVL